MKHSNLRQQAIDETRTSKGNGGFAIALAILHLADTLREVIGRAK